MALTFLSCSKSDDDGEMAPSQKESIFKIDKTDIVGVWRNLSSNTFLSFSSDKLFSGLMDEYTIDDGNYSINGDTIKVNNTYFGYDIRMVVISATDNTISLNIEYLSLSRNEELKKTSKQITFQKTDEAPCSKDNVLIGRSFSASSTYGGGSKYNFFVLKHNIMTYTLTSYSSGIVKSSGSVHYLYLPPKIYFTVYDDYGIFVYYGQEILNVREVNLDDGYISLKAL